MRRYLPRSGVPADVLPGVPRSAGLVCPPEPVPWFAMGGAALNGDPRTGPAASVRPLPARSAGATVGVLTFGTGAGVQTCWAAAGVASSNKTIMARIGNLRSGANVGGPG